MKKFHRPCRKIIQHLPIIQRQTDSKPIDNDQKKGAGLPQINSSGRRAFCKRRPAD